MEEGRTACNAKHLRWLKRLVTFRSRLECPEVAKDALVDRLFPEDTVGNTDERWPKTGGRSGLGV